MFSDFGDLDLIDDSDSARDRNERLSRAFEKSKESYAKELVYTEPEVLAAFLIPGFLTSK